MAVGGAGLASAALGLARILFDLLRERAIHPVVINCLPLVAAREAHTRVDSGGLGGKIVLLPWPEA